MPVRAALALEIRIDHANPNSHRVLAPDRDIRPGMVLCVAIESLLNLFELLVGFAEYLSLHHSILPSAHCMIWSAAARNCSASRRRMVRGWYLRSVVHELASTKARSISRGMTPAPKARYRRRS